MFYRQFYSELGKLLYAIADADGEISKKEKERLKEIVRKDLVPRESHQDEFGTDAAFYAEFEFDIMEDMIPEPQAAFESFINFIEDHKTAINERMIEVTRNVAEKLAEAYYHSSKKEMVFLKSLREKLDDLLKEKRK